MEDWLFKFLTIGQQPDNSGMTDYNYQPGSWECFCLKYGHDFKNLPPLKELWELHKEEIQKRFDGKTFAEKLIH